MLNTSERLVGGAENLGNIVLIWIFPLQWSSLDNIKRIISLRGTELVYILIYYFITALHVYGGSPQKL